jgi:hypothetical protein
VESGILQSFPNRGSIFIFRRLRENAKKRCLNENFLLLDTLYAMRAFFAPDHIKVFIFIKFLIPPENAQQRS